MYFATYTFTGDPSTLLAGYRKMLTSFPDEELILHVCVETATGLTIYDACPDRQAFDAFRTSTEFTAALADADLPSPVITGLGEVQNVVVRPAVNV